MQTHREDAAIERGTAGEERLWQAVIASTIQEWLHGPLRLQRLAEAFLFEDQIDFPEVCLSAGMDAGRLRGQLLKLRPQALQQQQIAHPQFAA